MVNTPFNKDRTYRKNLKYPQCFIYDGQIYIISINAEGKEFNYCLDTAEEAPVAINALVIPIEIDIHIVG